MSFIDAARYRLRNLFRGDSHARELDEELAHHLGLSAADAKAAAGGTMSDDDARRQARREFGNATYAKEERRTIAGLALFDAAGQDLRFISRLLRRRTAFAAVIVLTIALGIGAATSIYSVADAVLFRPLPFADAGRLITVWLERPLWKTNPALIQRWDRGELTLGQFRGWRAAQTTFVDVAAWQSASAMVGDDNAAEEMMVGTASASLLPVLGIHVERGSWFTESDEALGAAPVAVVSHETWAARFGSDPHIIGRVVLLDGVPHTIVGIMPRGFDLDRSGTVVAYWKAARLDTSSTNATSFGYRALGRLKPATSLAAATAESGRLLKELAAPDDDRVQGAALATLHADQTRTVRRPLLTLLVSAMLLLLIACLNVATLLMGEASSREHELRTRAALGATRPRLLRQLLTESVLLAGAGASTGVALAYFGTKLIVRSAPVGIPGLADVGLNLGVLGATLVAAVATGLLFGLAPAVSLSGSSQRVVGANSTVRGRSRGQRGLVACEVALSMVLLVGAGLLVRSFDKLSSIGFRSTNLLVASVRLGSSPLSDSTHTRALYAAIVRRLRALPDVDAAAVTSLPPFSTGSSSTSYEIEGRPTPRGGGAASLGVQRRSTSPEFFATAGVPIVAGRAYTDADRGDMPPVVVVSHALAQREWPTESAVGKRIKVANVWRTIVGVAGDIETERPSSDPPETFYAPLEQFILRATPSLLVRTRANTSDAVAEIRNAVRDVDADVTVSGVERMDDLVAASLADDRLRTELISLFAAIAVLLAAVGTYGVAATSAARRTREMAIRVAVGATSGSIARLIIGSAATGVAVGGAAGLGLALLGVRALAPFLYGVRLTDPAVYAGVALLLALTTLGATWIPARRATRVRLVETLTGDG